MVQFLAIKLWLDAVPSTLTTSGPVLVDLLITTTLLLLPQFLALELHSFKSRTTIMSLMPHQLKMEKKTKLFTFSANGNLMMLATLLRAVSPRATIAKNPLWMRSIIARESRPSNLVWLVNLSKFNNEI
jgi:hypothetical protein